MRLLLDAHLSPRHLAVPLRERSHDVRAVDEERDLDGAGDPELLELGAAEMRLMTTLDAKDFPDLIREWAEGSRHHAGCIVGVGFRSNEFGPLLRGLDSVLANHPRQEQWTDRFVFLARSRAL